MGLDISCLGSNGPCLAAFSCLIYPSWHMDQRSDSSELVSSRSAIPMNCKVNISYLFGPFFSFKMPIIHLFVSFKILINRFKCHQTVLLKLLNVEPLTRDLFRADPRVALQREYKVRDTQTDTQTDRRN